MKKLLAILSVVLFANAASADDEPTTFSVLGAGATNCAKYVEVYEKKFTSTIASYHQWLMGYITAVNQSAHMLKNVLKVENNSNLGVGKQDAFTLVLYNYCKENPLDRFQKGTEFLLGELVNLSE